VKFKRGDRVIHAYEDRGRVDILGLAGRVGTVVGPLHESTTSWEGYEVYFEGMSGPRPSGNYHLDACWLRPFYNPEDPT
jgi:hypothetical protein